MAYYPLNEQDEYEHRTIMYLGKKYPFPKSGKILILYELINLYEPRAVRSRYKTVCSAVCATYHLEQNVYSFILL